MNGVIHALEADTCNGKVYDFFVVAAGLSDHVQGPFTIGDAGLHPHSPSRLVIRGTPRKVMVRMLRAPTPLHAVLPHGPMEEETAEHDSVDQCCKPIDERYAEMASRTTARLGKLRGKVLGSVKGNNEWADGPKLVWRNVADPKATDEARSSPISRAWKRSLSWLRKVQAASTSKARYAAVWKLLHYRHHLLVHDPLLQEDAAAFRAWNSLLTREMLGSGSWVRALIEVARKASDQSEHRPPLMLLRGSRSGSKMGRQLGSAASICSRERRQAGPRIPRTNSSPLTFLNLMTLRVYLRRSSVRLWSHRKLPALRSGPSSPPMRSGPGGGHSGRPIQSPMICSGLNTWPL